MANPTRHDPLTPPTPSTPEPTASVPPKLRMCLKRNDDHFVPLVAVDELPSWIMLKGVPMTLRGEEVLRLGLVNCGDYSKTNDDYHQVELNEIPAEVHTCNVLGKPEADDSPISQQSSTTTGYGSKTSPDSFGKEKAHVKDIQTKISGSTMHSEVSPTTQGTAGTFGKKKYCTFWCRTGCCDYTQQGCKFLHEIPPDWETRKDIGLRDFPTWMLEEPRGPRPAKASSVDKMQEGNWRRGRTQDYQRVLPASPTPGHDRTLSHRVTSVPYSGRVQTSSLTQTPTMMPTNTGGQASGPRIPKLHKPQAAQQAALFLPVQQYCPSSTGSAINTRPQMQLNTFDGADGNMNFQSIISGGQEIFRFQYPTNEVFSNATVVGTNEGRPAPATQPPISRPVLSAQALSTSSRGKDTTNPTIYTPSQNAADTVPQARAPADSNTITSAHAMKANQKAFSTNGSGRFTSHARTPASSGANNAAAGDGADQTLSSLVDSSIPSPPIMHRRLFVSPGKPQYMANPIGTGSSKPRQHSRSKRGANAKGRGYGAGKASQLGKAQGQGGQQEDLLVL